MRKVPFHLGHFFITIDTAAFMGTEEFKKTAGDVLRTLRASKKAPGQERIYTAGEKEWDVWLDRKENGLPINEEIQHCQGRIQNRFCFPPGQIKKHINKENQI